MRLLITRPEPDGDRTGEILLRLGHRVVQAPMLRRVKLAQPEVDLAPAAIAFTSRNAIRAVQDWPVAAKWKDLPVFTVGEASAEAAMEVGFSDVRSAKGAGADLAAKISGALSRDATVLYPNANERSDGFENEMQKAGFKLVAIEAYRMEEARALPGEIVRQLNAGEIDGVLLYSERTARVFAGLAEKAGCAAACQGLQFYVLSARIAAVLAPLQGARTLIAGKPDEEHLIHLIPRR